MKSAVFLLYVLLAAQQSNAADKKKLLIEILYESLCPDSTRFMSNQLSRAYDNIAPYVDIKFVPFGKSFSSNGSFDCQHGPQECMGNKIQSCAFVGLKDQPKKQVTYATCFMNSYWKNIQEKGQNCATSAGLIWKNVEQCFESAMGTNLQLEAEMLTNVYNPAFIPTIVFNKVFDQDHQDNALKNFMSVVCELTENKPEKCAANTKV